MSERREAGIPPSSEAGPERPGPKGQERENLSERREAGIPPSSEASDRDTGIPAHSDHAPGIGSTAARTGRSVAAVLLVALTVVGLVLSSAALWARGVVFEEDRWITTVRDLPRQPDIAEALADYLTEELFVAIDVEARIASALPDEVDVIVPILAEAMRGLVTDQTVEFIESDTFRDFWITANREAHRLLMAILDDQPLIPGLERSDDRITLDLVPAINALLEQVADAAGNVVGQDITLPEIDDDDDTKQSIRQLGQRLGVDLPDDFGQITIYEGDKLPQPRDTIVLIERIRVLAVVATIVFGALAILVAPNRRRVILGLLVGAAAGFALLLTLPDGLRDAVGDLVSDDQNRAAARTAVEVVFQSYVSLYQWMLATALFSAVAILLTGPSRAARWIRREVRVQVDRVPRSREAATFIRRYVVWLRVGGPALGILYVLVLTGRSLNALFMLFALVTAWEALLSLVRAESDPTVRAPQPDA